MLDISTVQTFDSFFARTIAETVQMVGLMGTHRGGGDAGQRGRHRHPLGLTMGRALTALDVDRAFDLLNQEPRNDDHL